MHTERLPTRHGLLWLVALGTLLAGIGILDALRPAYGQ